MSGSSSSNSNSSQRRRSQNTSSSSGPVDECRCGMKLPVLTAWTDQNPGRRFQKCPNYGKPSYCGVFVWLDPDICERGRELLPKMHRTIMRLEDEIYWFKRRENCLKDELIEYQKREKSLESIVIDCKRIENNLRAEIADSQEKRKEFGN
ncbi:hypothetical protein BUALT_Bualt02G0077800 [Buddleja alternifolia]|uniref:GRF-type domain-containing protein n=1 Tax=Buddleja alternifolia TaxID=168488 RepID=A0AAV6Y8Z3_9LAMI|nr:hypothetical protein BUALT_Bualt02G0077800 [Buddleja alternifolia]